MPNKKLIYTFIIISSTVLLLHYKFKPSKTIQNKADPTPNPDLDGYCGYDRHFYPTKEDAHKNNTNIMTCGPCGECSTIHDILLYHKTKNNLTEVTRMCAFKSLFSEQWGLECMQQQVGFTPKCNECWMENIKCDRNNCKWICLWSLFIGEPFVDEHGKLNKCLQCDEDNCGPAFKKCAGANRRRACIRSDIIRDDQLICKECEKVRVE